MSKAEDRKELKAELETLKEELAELEAEKEDIETNYDNYDEVLDEQGEIKIGNLSYSPSYVLKNVDEIAYRCGFNDFIDEPLSEKENEIADKESEIEEKQGEIDSL